jgi:quercetin dioxygenase-like cupin family protein
MTAESVRAIHLGPGEGETISNPAGGPLTFKVRGKECNGAVTAWEAIAAPGEGPPLHVHPDLDEILYMLDGSFRVKLESGVDDAPAGTFVFIPRGAHHTWQNVGDAPGRFLLVLVPAGLEALFERFGALDDAPAMETFFRTYGPEAGMEVVGPPLATSDPL